MSLVTSSGSGRKYNKEEESASAEGPHLNPICKGPQADFLQTSSESTQSADLTDVIAHNSLQYKLYDVGSQLLNTNQK